MRQVRGRISIHAPRVGSDACNGARRRQGVDFNPRSPCGERRRTKTPPRCEPYFNPRSPCGERRASALDGAGGHVISIHAPRVGSDYAPARVTIRRWLFQSTLPVWGATRVHSIKGEKSEFQSTLPVWGATRLRHGVRLPGGFQSTLPVWGATWQSS